MNTLHIQRTNKSVGGIFRSVLVVLILMALSQVLPVGPTQAQEATGAPLSAPCFEVLSSETTIDDERGALIKLKGRILSKATEGELLVLVSPECLADKPAVDKLTSGKPIGGDTAAAREAINQIVSELVANDDADEDAVMDGADKIRNFVDKYEDRADVTNPLAEAAEQTSGGKEAAMIAAMVAMCLGLSAGLTCTLPAMLGGLLLLGADISDEDFQTGIRIMTKVATGQALDTTDYGVLADREVPTWVQDSIRMIPGGDVGGYIRTVGANAVASRVIEMRVGEIIDQLAEFANEQDSITCRDVYRLGGRAIRVDVNQRRKIESMLLPASRSKSPEEIKHFLDCLDRAFPME